MEKTSTHGGARKGAGRPKKAEETTVLHFRVPAKKAPALKRKIASLIEKEKKRPLLKQEPNQN